MAEATRFKDLLEAQKRLDGILQAETLKRDASELKLQEKMDVIAGKYDQLACALGDISLQLLNISGGKGHAEEESILGPKPSSQSSGGSKWHIENPNPQSTFHAPKVDFPRFDGSNPRSWVMKCNGYFKLMPPYTDTYKITLASVHLEGRAATWFQNFDTSVTGLSWAQFVDIIAARFEDLKETKVIAEFTKLKQTGSYASYVDKFEELKACISLLSKQGYTEEFFVATFISGLTDDMQSFMYMFAPKTLQHAIELGQQQSLAIEAITKKVKGPVRGYSAPYSTYKKPDTPVVIPKASTPTTTRLLTSAEMAARREKGLCYNCDEQYKFGHRCKNRIIFMIMTEEEELNYLQGSETVEEPPDPLLQQMEEVQMSLNALAGEEGITTMRVLGEIAGHKLHILIDSGSTLSFIQEKTARKLGCSLVDSKPLLIRVANGQKMISTQQVANFKWKMQEREFSYSPRLLDNVGCDMILGGDWLKSCTPVELDYEGMSVTVTKQGEKIKLQAITAMSNCKFITAHSLYKLIHYNMQDRVEEIFVLMAKDTEIKENPDLQDLLTEFQDIFEEPTELPPSRGVEHQILLKPNSVPKHQHPYRTSHNHKNVIEEIVADLLRSGIIQHSKSPFASPVILVKKKDNTWRMCVDYRYLNTLTIKHEYPIPIIDELLDELYGAKFFSKMDLRSGYFQILMRPEDRYLTAFSTHHGHFEFLVMPFGLCNAPATFQSLMNITFQEYLRKFVLVFFDDILVYSTTWAAHLEHLRKVLMLLRQNKLFAKKSKCSFGQKQVEYLGHIISHNGVATDPAKISSMVNWPLPKTVKQLRGFLGLTGYYRKFVKNYGSISKPLTELLKKDNFKWNSAADASFQQLKQAMVTAPVLGLPDFSKSFVIETDASGFGIGAVLMQSGKPIAFLSKSLCPRNQALSIYEREFLAVLLAIEKWRSYLQQKKFVIKTDQQALKYLLDQKVMNPMQQKWLTKLLGLDYEIQYKKGSENKVADALSRCEIQASTCDAITTASPTWAQKVTDSYSTDPFFSKILSAKLIDNLAYPEFSLSNGLLRYKNRIGIGSDSQLRALILSAVHDSSFGGHSGIHGTYMRLKGIFYWPNMKNDVVELIRGCDVCQRNKGDSGPYPGLLQPLPIPSQAWTHISMDFVEGLPKSGGKDVILVVVDRFTKYSHFLALSHPFSAPTVAKLFLDSIYKLHGQPVSIVTDRDKVFTSSFWQELFKLMGVKLNMSTAYHPQTDGQTERVNQCLENYLRCMVSFKPKQWLKWLPLAEYCYNTNFHSSLKLTPFQALYGYPPPFFSISSHMDSINSEATETLVQRQQMAQLLRENLIQAQQRMKFFADKNRQDRKFEVGDFVYLKLQPFRQNSVALRRNLKLAAKFYGPYKVLQKVGQVAYRLDLPNSSKIHPIFHVSLLKKCISSKVVPLQELPVPDDAGEFIVSPLGVLAHREIKRRSATVAQVLVNWCSSGPALATWEDLYFIRKKFPSLYPWGQGLRLPGGIVTIGADAVEEVKLESGEGIIAGGKLGIELIKKEEDVANSKRENKVNGKNGFNKSSG